LAARACGLLALRLDDLAFIDLVVCEAHLPREDAERAIHATLQTLGERIDRGQARRLAAQLPEDDVRALALAP
jgi:uncharacterized protein (DUF2267 family)